MASGIFSPGGNIAAATRPLALSSFTVDMIVDKTTNPDTTAVASPNDTTDTLPGHSNASAIANALMLDDAAENQSLYVEFLWNTTGSTAGINFLCQVNFEEIGRDGASKDMNVANAAIAFVSGTNTYKDVVKVDIGTAAGELGPGLYSVTALFFVQVPGATATDPMAKGLGGFAEVGKLMIA